MSKSPIPLITSAALAFAMMSLPGLAETMQYSADLSAAAEVPPTDSTGSGSAEFTVDTEAKTISWTVTVEGLTGDATAAHIHGPPAKPKRRRP